MTKKKAEAIAKALSFINDLCVLIEDNGGAHTLVLGEETIKQMIEIRDEFNQCI